MDCKTAKNIQIVDFLRRVGFTTETEQKYIAWYCSPFRDEKTASFKVDKTRNTFVDFGSGQQGDIIKLVQIMYNLSVPDALKILETKATHENILFSPAKEKPTAFEPAIKILSVKELNNNYLVQYIEIRGIPLILAKIYVSEIEYTSNSNGKNYYSIGFKNDKGGFELRNQFFKNCSSPKFYTTIHPDAASGYNNINLFEGFIDFLSALQYYNVEKPKGLTIVLNSLINLNLVLPLLSKYKTINLYLDNDNPGKEATAHIKEKYNNAVDKASAIYPNHKDFNDFLIDRFKQNKPSVGLPVNQR